MTKVIKKSHSSSKDSSEANMSSEALVLFSRDFYFFVTTVVSKKSILDTIDFMISECHMINHYLDNKSQMRCAYICLHGNALDLGVPD